MTALLQVRGLTKRYGGLIALDGCELNVEAGSITGVIGPNGAGKSTLIGLLGGALTPTSGAIVLDGDDITRRSAADRARIGIGRTYQIPRPFLDMTVIENLLLAARVREGRHGHAAQMQHCRAILARTALADVADRPARTLPLLRRKRLEVARALAVTPRILLLDEVGAGLVDHELTELITLINNVRAEGVTIVLVEHVLRVVRECCDALTVLNFGRVLAAGPTTEVLASDEVAAVYLGTRHAAQPTPTAAALDTAPLRCLVAPPTQDSEPVLSVQALTAAHGQSVVLRDVSLEVRRGEAVAVLGANGAGKTSFALALSGVLAPRTGTIAIAGHAISSGRADRVTALGVAHCMEGRRIFSDLSVEENLMIAARQGSPRDIRARRDAVYGLFPVLHERRHDPGTAMSGGQQQMLAIGRALMNRPMLVIFDEISLGLAPVIMDRLYEALAALKHAGLTLVLVEQDVERALDIADRAFVLENGSIALQGTAAEVRSDPRLRHLYVGEPD